MVNMIAKMIALGYWFTSVSTFRYIHYVVGRQIDRTSITSLDTCNVPAKQSFWGLDCEACILYLQGYLKECSTLPPDYISTLSFFFPVFPAYDAAVAFSCLEFFLEWRYLPDFKLWRPLILLGTLVAMATSNDSSRPTRQNPKTISGLS